MAIDYNRDARERAMVRETLQQISELIEKHHGRSNRLAIALSGDDALLWDYLVSSELWGGAGSVADHGLIDRDGRIAAERRDLEHLMIRLGREQIRLGKTNERTEMWVEAFEKWEAQGIR